MQERSDNIFTLEHAWIHPLVKLPPPASSVKPGVFPVSLLKMGCVSKKVVQGARAPLVLVSLSSLIAVLKL